MKVLLEVFFLKIVAGDVLYTKYRRDVSEEKSRTLDPIAVEYYRSTLGRHAPSIGEKCFMHSCSWYSQSSSEFGEESAVVLPYIFYSEDFDFKEQSARRLGLKELDFRPPLLPENDGVCSEKDTITISLRHLAFLVQTDDGTHNLENIISQPNARRFKTLPIGLAGKIPCVH